MEISAVMNIHDLAMNKAVRHQADGQARQEKMHQQIEAQEANQTSIMSNKTPLETHPGAFTNTVQQQEDPQAVKNRIERQVDVQAAKETAQGAENKGQANTGAKETGTYIDIVT